MTHAPKAPDGARSPAARPLGGASAALAFAPPLLTAALALAAAWTLWALTHAIPASNAATSPGALPSNDAAPTTLALPSWAWPTLVAIAIAAITASAMLSRMLLAEAAALRAIRTGLDAFARGERAPDALAARPDSGRLADTWNALLDWIADARADALDQHATDALANGRERRSDLRDACDALWLGLVVLDEQGAVRYANGAAAALLGRPGHDLLSADFAALASDEHVTGTLRAVLGGATRQRKSVESDRRSPDGDGGVLRFTFRPSRRDDSGAALILIEDVTQLRVADAARSSFVAQAAHELRTPLTNIRLYAEELLDAEADAPADPARQQAINVINQETRRLDRIVADMLSMSEIEAGQLSIRADDLPLADMLADLRAEYDAQARERSITFSIDLPPKLPMLRADRDKISLAIHNLVGNAMKYTPDGGAVTVSAKEDGPIVRIDVQDTGIGISTEDSKRIFEKFVRAKDHRINAIPGTGLGLALAREVVRLHGGDVTLESELDKGSTFTLSLPVTAQAA